MIAILINLIFVADLLLPNEVAISSLYLLAIVLCLGQTSRTIILFAGITSFLSLLVSLLLMEYQSNYRIWMNRFISVVAIWVITVIAIRNRKLEKQREKDLNDLKLMNDEIKQYAFIAAHDLQEPLRSITIFIDRVKTKYLNGKNPQLDFTLNQITESSDLMRSRLNSLLKYSLTGRNKKLVKIHMDQLLDEVRYDLQTIIKSSKARFEITELPAIQGYRLEIYQLVCHLVRNAIMYRKPNVRPVIKIKGLELESEWLFSISDNGIGIDEEYHDKIFELFQKLNGDDSDGQGLGLAHCKKISRIHNGDIWLESQEHKGTVVYFTVAKDLE